ncbi:hypothetical protein [Robinsoniella peoriensis]|uniref:hypothetical protein n=1 Tax=Robinsoniella peoriensis TaxID=180332 RepID=UPI0005C7C7FE|nr:hypothetical protein [Robinsoniella peoriensis]
MDVEKLFKEYTNWKRDMGLLEFELSRFQGVPYDDVIESLCFSRPEGDRVQTSEISDKTGKTAIIYRQVKERLDDEWFDYLIERYESVNGDLEFFEYAIGQLSGKLPEVIWDMVIEQMTWRELSGKYDVSETMIAKYRKKAISELTVIYQIREQTAERYLLS